MRRRLYRSLGAHVTCEGVQSARNIWAGWFEQNIKAQKITVVHKLKLKMTLAFISLLMLKMFREIENSERFAFISLCRKKSGKRFENSEIFSFRIFSYSKLSGTSENLSFYVLLLLVIFHKKLLAVRVLYICISAWLL